MTKPGNGIKNTTPQFIEMESVSFEVAFEWEEVDGSHIYTRINKMDPISPIANTVWLQLRQVSII